MNPLIIVSVLLLFVVIVTLIVFREKKKDPPTSACLLTTKTYADGARCDGAGERRSPDWCCDDYGISKGYKWTV